MSAVPEQTWSAEAYLEFERANEEKHEYLDGNIYLMTGASANHNLIVTNTVASLHTQLRKRPCIVYPSDLRVRVSRTGLYTYPDISVVCGTPQYADKETDTLLNPTLIVEVLSPATERYDRGKKFQHYRKLDSLQEYVLIAQDIYHIERYLRQEGDEWLLTDVSGVDASIEFTSIQCALTLADVYEKVTFESEQP